MALSEIHDFRFRNLWLWQAQQVCGEVRCRSTGSRGGVAITRQTGPDRTCVHVSYVLRATLITHGFSMLLVLPPQAGQYQRMDASSQLTVDTPQEWKEPSQASPWKPTQPLFQEDPNADVILRARDGFRFRAQKNILAIASPMFRDMFKVGGVLAEDQAQLAVVPMIEETGEVVEKLLWLCYPLSPPAWCSAAALYPVITAAIKYQLEEVLDMLKKELLSPRFLETEPLRVFAIACRANWQEGARRAAQYTLKKPEGEKPTIEELRYISGFSIHRLVEYRRDCSAAASSLVDMRDLHWDTRRNWVWNTCPSNRKDYPRFKHAHSDSPTQRWCDTYLTTVRPILTVAPTSGSATAEEAMRPALQQAVKCSHCASEAFWDLKGFSELLAREVDKKTKELADTYDFCG